MKALKEDKTTGKVDARKTFELIYISFLRYVDNRRMVEIDLKELETMLYNCAYKMMDIMNKSKSKIG